MKKTYILQILAWSFAILMLSCSKDDEPSSLEKGLVAYFPFNSNAKDFGGNSYDGIVSGATLTNDRNGKSNSAYEFNGISDYIEIPNFGNIVPSQEISVSIWIQSNFSRPQFQLMLCPDNNRFAISAFYNHSEMNTTFWDFGWEGETGNAPGRLYFRPEPVDKLWHHYVFVSSLSNSYMNLYKDGIMVNEKTEPKELLHTSNKTLKIGSGDGFGFHSGKIDEIRIYNRVLTQVEIDKLYKMK
ncbi:MAG: LamG domain-containing protein [Prolixibacteraceae bacterium]|nr:LamG domain-containing protein [Prolixibacteraceae bacterium]